MLDKLGSGLKKALEKVTKSGYVDEDLVDELVRDIQRTLLSGDVDVELVFELTKKIKERALDEKPKAGLTAKEHVINIVYEEMVRILGEEKKEVTPGDILIIGLFGSGKTTSTGKMAKYFQKRGYKVGVVGCDVHRPAAMDQISQISDKLNIDCYAPKDAEDAAKIAKEGLKKMKNADIILFDSSGRDALDEELARELRELEDMIDPEEILLTVPADLGQSAGEQAKRFNELVGITGLILTKMDASAKGGGALTSSNITEAPIKFIGTGEGMEDLEEYNPERFVSR
ncbi:MAG: signal recognition particle receptor subunit alpha, partial [Candidatus Aenigmatarchaeota archaeon]